MVWVLGEQIQDPLDCFLKVVIFVKFLVATVMQSNLSKKKNSVLLEDDFKDLHMQLAF